jgi:hypothetical protein
MTSSRPSRNICARTKPQRPKSMRQPRRCSRKHRRRHRLRLPRPAPRPALTLYIRIGQLIKGGKGKGFLRSFVWHTGVYRGGKPNGRATLSNSTLRIGDAASAC